jgi:hypothetical protein
MSVESTSGIQHVQDRPSRELDRILLTEPWNTATYKVIWLVRSSLLTVFWLPLLIAISMEHRWPIAILPLLILCDIWMRRNVWRASELELARAAARDEPITSLPHPDTTRAVRRNALLLCAAYAAIAAIALGALAISPGDEIRRAVAILFTVSATAMSLGSAAFIANNAAALVVSRNGGDLRRLTETGAVTAFDVVFPLWFFPTRIRIEIATLATMVLGLFVISLHSIVLAHILFALNVSTSAIVMAMVTFALQFSFGFILEISPIAYLLYRSNVAARSIRNR